MRSGPAFTERAIVTGLIVCTLLVSFVFVYPRHWTRGFLGPDEAWHANLSRHVVAGDGYVSDTLFPMDARAVEGFPVPEPLKQSGISLVTAIVWSVFGESERSVVVIAMVLFALTVGLTYSLAYRLTENRGLSLFVAGLVLTNPQVISAALVPTPTSLVQAMFVMLVLLVIDPTPRRLIAAGVVFIVLLLAKGYGILYLFPILGYLAAVCRGARLPFVFAASVTGWAVLALVVLPAGSVQLFSSGSNYSLAFLHEWYYPRGVYGFHDLDPPNAYAVIAQNPGDFAVHYARLASRTKRILDAWAAPAIGGLFFPCLWVAMLLLPADRYRPGRLLPRVRTGMPSLVTDGKIITLFSSSILVSFLFFWTISSPRIVYWVHLFPIMLLLCASLVWRLMPDTDRIPRMGRQVLVGAAVVFCLVYPLAQAVREVYRDPYAYLGRSIPVRQVDFEQMSRTVSTWVPSRDDVVVADMHHEITWWNRNPTIAFPLDETQLDFLVRRFNVQALHEFPGVQRDWDYIRSNFRLVDDANGRLWVRHAAGN